MVVATGVLALVALATGLGLERAERRRAEDAERRIRSFCATCHGFTEPSLLPRSAWRPTVERMIDLYDTDGTASLPAGRDECLEFFVERAPERVAVATPDFARSELVPKRFTVSPPGTATELEKAAVRTLSVEQGALISCTDRGVLQVEAGRDWRCGDPLADLRDVTALATTDLDGDGRVDRVFALSGSDAREDHQRGRVVLHPGTEPALDVASTAPPRVVVSDEGRISDVVAADFDGDGRDELVVAVRGYYRTGSLLHVRASAGAPPDAGAVYDVTTLDPRGGAVRLSVADFDGDGRPDVVAALGGRFQSVVVFLARERGHFEARTLFEAGQPCFGLTSLAVADVDVDGDLDIVLTAGDGGPEHVEQPFHGVHLLRTADDGTCVHEFLAAVPRAADVRVVSAPAGGVRAFVRTEDGALLVLDPSRPGAPVSRVQDGVAAIAAGDLYGDGKTELVAAFAGTALRFAVVE